jgi:hypothetical protein
MSEIFRNFPSIKSCLDLFCEKILKFHYSKEELDAKVKLKLMKLRGVTGSGLRCHFKKEKCNAA